MAAGAAPESSADRVAALDVLRGIAALLMVFNHVGYAMLTPHAATHGVSGAIVFLGSFAPVLFFLATGFGAGLAPRAGSWASLADKVLLLVLADQFLAWRGGRAWGLDFFSFIAVCMVAARAVLASARPVVVAGALIAVVLVVRYGFGQWLDATVGGVAVLGWLIGWQPDPQISYPASPWLVYPLLGLVLGIGWRTRRGVIPSASWWALAAVCVAFAAAAAVFHLRGASFHRWSSVAAGFFALSIVVALVFAAASVALTRAGPTFAGALSLGGVASFAVVPWHYLAVNGSVLAQQDSTGVYVASAALVAAASFVLSRGFERAVAACRATPWRVAVTALVVVICAAGTLAFGSSGKTVPAQWLCSIGQLAVGVLFAWRAGLFSAGLAAGSVAPGVPKT